MEQVVEQSQKVKIKGMMVEYLMTVEGIPEEIAMNGETRVEDLGIDSLNIVEMLYMIEDKYGIRVDNLGVLKDMTIDAMAEFLNSLAASKVAA
ncbi:acyl carrier protein [Herbaspirillum sp. HC18]|nr:acyl carrier protein [Herbaspirillum sp. HC18]